MKKAQRIIAFILAVTMAFPSQSISFAQEAGGVASAAAIVSKDETNQPEETVSGEAASQEAAARSAASQDADERGSSSQDAVSRNVAAQNTSVSETLPDTALREASSVLPETLPDTISQDAASQGTNSQETNTQSTASQDTGSRDTTSGAQTSSDAVSQDTAAQDTISQELSALPETIPDSPSDREDASSEAGDVSVIGDAAGLIFDPDASGAGGDWHDPMIEQYFPQLASGVLAAPAATLKGDSIYILTYRCGGNIYEETVDLSNPHTVDLPNLAQTLGIEGEEMSYAYPGEENTAVSVDFDEEDRAKLVIGGGFSGEESVYVEMDYDDLNLSEIRVSAQWLEPEPETVPPTEPETKEPETQSESDAPQGDPFRYVDENNKEYSITVSKGNQLGSWSYGWWNYHGTFSSGWYAANGSTAFSSSRLVVNGDARLILCNGCTLTLETLTVNKGASLTIYGQKGGNGALKVKDASLIEGSVRMILPDAGAVNVNAMQIGREGSFELYGVGSGTGSVTVSDGLEVLGSMQLHSGKLNLTGFGLANSGSLSVKGAAVSLPKGEINNSGSLSVAKGSLTLSAGSITNTGELSLSDGALTLTDGSVQNKGTLKVSGGTLSGGADGELISNAKGGVLEISGGSFSGSGKSNTYAIVMLDGIGRMSGGSIGSGFTYGVTVSDGSFIMSGGEITGQKKQGARVMNGSFTMSGGTLSGNGQYGAWVGRQSSRQTTGGTFTMTGGEITNNAVAGISLEEKGVLQMNGKPMVRGNGTGTNAASDVLLGTGQVITLLGKLDKEARVGVRSYDTRTLLPVTKNYKKYYYPQGITGDGLVLGSNFFSNEDERRIRDQIEDGEVCLMDNRAVRYRNANGGYSWCGSFVYVRSNDSTNNTWGTDWYVLDRDEKFDNKRLDIVGDVNLILCDGATLTCTDGIYVAKNASLTIWCQGRGNGRLLAYCNGKDAGDWAGIGGNGGDNAGHGNITIYGGRITARGGDDSAGIGCGPNSKGSGSIRIYGGTINAKGGKRGAGIGGGLNRGNRPIYIYGGAITATGGDYAAGIGGGGRGSQDNSIYIYGGTVKAYGGTDAAGIGGGEELRGGGDGGNVYVYGGSVYAEGKDLGAGIGGGEDGKGGNLYYYGGRVEAIASAKQSAIGKGDGGSGNGDIIFNTGAKVSYGSELTLAASANRVSVCRSSWHAVIEPCDHAGRTYSNITRLTHDYSCPYCGKRETVGHTFSDVTGACGCGYSITIVDGDFWLIDGASRVPAVPKAFRITTDEAGTKEPEKSTTDNRHYYIQPGTTVYFRITPPDRTEFNDVTVWYYKERVSTQVTVPITLVKEDASTGERVYRASIPQTFALHCRVIFARPANTIAVDDAHPERTTLEISHRKAMPGTKITFTVKAKGDNVLNSVYVTSPTGAVNSSYTYDSKTKIRTYTFTMPDREATIHIECDSPWERLQRLLNIVPDDNTSGRIDLTSDVIADASDTALVVPAYANVTINMHGYTIDRAAALESGDGGVFKVYGSLTIINTYPQEGGIKGGRAHTGGAFLVKRGGSLTLKGANMPVTGNYATRGGAIYVEAGGRVNLEQCDITGNTGYLGGGVYNEGGTVSLGIGCTVENNQAISSGGGFYQRSGSLQFATGCRAYIRDNTAKTYGNNLLLGPAQKIHIGGGYYYENCKIGVSVVGLPSSKDGMAVITDGLSKALWRLEDPATKAFFSEVPGFELGRNAAGEAILVQYTDLTLYEDIAGKSVWKKIEHQIPGEALTDTMAPYLSGPGAVESGYEFAGWTTIPKESGVYAIDGKLPEQLYVTTADFAHLKMPAGGLDLYPVLRSKKATVRFKDTALPSKTLYYRETLKVPAILSSVPEGKRFLGWTGPNGTFYEPNEAFTFSDWSLVKADAVSGENELVFTPSYEDIPRYQVTFESAGGTVIRSLEVYEGESVEDPGDPERAGFLFDGWKTEGTLVTFPIKNVQKDLTLTAQWKQIVLEKATLTGEALTGETLQVSYTPEDAVNVTYQWYRAKMTPAAGTTSITTVTTRTPVEGATESTYPVTLDDYSTYDSLGPNQYLYVEVTQTLDDGTTVTKTAKTGKVEKKAIRRVTVHLDPGAVDANGTEANYQGWVNPAASSYTDENTPAYLDAAQRRSFVTGMKESLDMSALRAVTRPGYELDGWYTGGGLLWGEDYVTAPEYCDASEPVSSEENKLPYDDYTLTLTARWNPVQVDVRYKGSSQSADAKTALGGSFTIADEFEAPPAGQRLKGWQDKKGRLYAAGETFSFTDWTLTAYDAANQVYYLVFTPAYEDIPVYLATFDANGGSFADGQGYAGRYFEEGSALELPEDTPAREGYLFDGWYVQIPAASESEEDREDPLTGFDTYRVYSDLTVKAHWKPASYSLTFDANGGSFSDPETKILTRLQTYNKEITLPDAPVRAHYTFMGWTPALPPVMPEHAILVKAVWEEKTYQIGFDAGSGSFARAELSKEGAEKGYASGRSDDKLDLLVLSGAYNTPVTAPADPVWEGHTFIEWLDANGKSAAVPAAMPDTFEKTGDTADLDLSKTDQGIPLYHARWKENQDTPSAPEIVTAKTTDTTITVKAVTGQAYSIDGGKTWVASDGEADETTGAQAGELTFTDLSPATEYEIITYIPGSDALMDSAVSGPARETTKKSAQSRPDAPKLTASLNALEVASPISGQEYAIFGINETIPDDAEKIEWKTPTSGSLVFDRLAEDTQYQVITRKAENQWQYASEISEPTAAWTDKTLLKGVSLTGELVVEQTLTAAITPAAAKDVRYEWYRCREVHLGRDGIPSLIEGAAGTSYTLTAADVDHVIIVKAIQTVAGRESVTAETRKGTVKKKEAPAPASVAASANESTLTVTAPAADGTWEYSLDGETWQDGSVFYNLTPDTLYTVYAHSKETDTCYAGTPGSTQVKTAQVVASVYEVLQNENGTWSKPAATKALPDPAVGSYVIPAVPSASDTGFTPIAYSRNDYADPGDPNTGKSIGIFFGPEYHEAGQGYRIALSAGTRSIYIYYQRNRYDLTFYQDIAGQQILKRFSVYYGTPLSAWQNETAKDPKGVNHTGEVALSEAQLEGYTFAGWSLLPKTDGDYSCKNAALRGTDHAHTDEYTLVDLTQRLMQDGDLNLYPVLIPDGMRIHLDLGAVDKNAQSKDAVPTNMENWINPNADAYKAADPNGVTAVDLMASQYRSFITENKEKLRTTKFESMTRPGYLFDGWYTSGGLRWNDAWGLSPEYADRSADGSYVMETNEAVPCTCYVLTLTAHWKPMEIEAVFGENEETFAVSLGHTLTLPVTAANPPEGKRLAAWEDASHETYAPGETFLFTDWSLTQKRETASSADGGSEDILKFTPVFENIPVYSVIFNTNGGSFVKPVFVKEGDPLEAPAVPTRLGYDFAGWYQSGTKVQFPIQEVKENLSLEAHWEASSYQITFRSNGGQFTDDETADAEVTTITRTYQYGASLSALAEDRSIVPVREYYNFIGWTPSLPETMPVGDLTLSAVWEPKQYQIALSANGGKFPEGEKEKETHSGSDEQIIITGVYGSPIAAAADPSLEGYTFCGWKPAIPEYMPAVYEASSDDPAQNTQERPLYKAFWKINQEAPERPDLIAGSTTDTSLTVVYVPGQVYSIDGGKTWYPADDQAEAGGSVSAQTDETAEPKTLTFTGLSAATAYQIVTKKLGDDAKMESPVSDAASAVTDRMRQSAPDAPMALPSLNSIDVLAFFGGLEYAIFGMEEEIPADSEAIKWEKPVGGVVTFSNLASDTLYKIVARRVGTDKAYPSPASAATEIYTRKILLTGVSITGMSEGTPKIGETLNAQITPLGADDVTYQWYRKDASGSSETGYGELIQGASEGSYTPTEADYEKILTVVATQTVHSGNNVTVSAGTDAARKADGPAAPQVRAQAGEITITVTSPVAGEDNLPADVDYEYSLDGYTWQDSPIFENLVQNTDYTVYARGKETAARQAGAVGSMPVKTLQTIADVYEVLQNTDGTWSEPVSKLLSPAEGSYVVSADAHPVSLTEKEGRAYFTAMGWSRDTFTSDAQGDPVTPIGGGEQIILPAGTKKIYIYYARDLYDLTFYQDIAGQQLKKRYHVYYGTPLSAWQAKEGGAADPAGESYASEIAPGEQQRKGYTFAGWSMAAKTDGDYSCKDAALRGTSHTHTEEYTLADLGSMTMPGEDLNLYPVLIPDGMRIHLDLGAVDKNAQSKDATPTNMENWINPNAAAYKAADPNGVTAVDLMASQYRSFITENKETLRTTKFESMTRPGYTFDGWYTSGGLRWNDDWGLSPEFADRSADGSYVMETNEAVPCTCYVLTLTAHWTPKKITVIFGEKPNTGSIRLGEEMSLQTFALDVPDGQKLAAWKDKNGREYDPGETFLFADWSLTESGETEDILKFEPVFEQIPIYTVTFDSNGGSYVESISFQEGDTLIWRWPKEPTRTGYTFAGWFDSEGKELERVSSIHSNLTLTARWTPNSYTITFDSKGGSTAEAVTLPYGSEIPSQAEPEKSHYRFMGWKPALPATMPAYDLTVQAEWEPKQYQIAFSAGEGSFSEEELSGHTGDGSTERQILVTGLYGAPVIIPASPKREGYTFAGWDKEVPIYMPDAFEAPASGQLLGTAQQKLPVYTALWKQNQSEPDAPTVLGKTDTSVTVRYEDGQVYSIDDGKTWFPAAGEQTGAEGMISAHADETAKTLTFTGLSPVTEYEIVTKKPGSDERMESKVSAPTPVKTDRAEREAPEAPGAASDTQSIEITTVIEGQEYGIADGSSVIRWITPDENGRVIFTDLERDHSYDLYARWMETDDYKESPASQKTTVYTAAALLTDVSFADVNAGASPYGQTLQAELAPANVDGVVSYAWYRQEQTDDENTDPTGRDPAQGDTDRSYGSPLSGVTGTSYAPAPEDVGCVITAAVTQRTQGGAVITRTASARIVKAAGEDAPELKAETEKEQVKVTAPVSEGAETVYEYRLDDGQWQDSPIFTGLMPGSVHIVYARSKETQLREAGQIGRLAVKTQSVTTRIYEVIQSVDGSWAETPVPVFTTENDTFFAFQAPYFSMRDRGMEHFALAGWNTSNDFGSMTRMETADSIYFSSFDENIYIFYTRKNYQLTFYQDIAGTQVKETFAVPYGASLKPWFTSAAVDSEGRNHLQQVTLAEHTFAGWSEKKKTDGSYTYRAAQEGSDEYALADLSSETMPGEDLSLYPVLIPNRVEVHLNTGAGDAAFPEDTQTIFMADLGEMLGNELLSSVSRPGYDLDGWDTQSGIRWDPARELTSVCCDTDERGEAVLLQHPSDPYAYYTLTLTAKWTAKEVTAVFGTNADTAQTSLGRTITLPAQADTAPAGKRLVFWQAPTENKDTILPGGSFAFTDWSLTSRDADGKDILFFTPVYEDIPAYVVSFDTDGGSYVESQTVMEGASALQPADPFKAGYTFAGWMLGDQQVTFPYPVEGAVTFKAAWRVNRFRVTYDANGGSFGETGGEEKTHLTQEYDFASSISEPEDPALSHYQFIRWMPGLPETMPAYDLSVKAVWEPVVYEICFDAGEGTFPVKEGEDLGEYNAERDFCRLNGYYGSPLSAPADPVRDGFVFDGWDQEVPDYMPDTFVMPEDSQADFVPLTIHAVWKEIQPKPEKPEVIGEKTESNSITVAAKAGQEYSIDRGKTWRKAEEGEALSGGEGTYALTFAGLSPASEYKIITRLPAAEGKLESEPSDPTVAVTDRAKQSAPEAPEVVSFVDEIEVSPVIAGLEYSIDGGATWQKPDRSGRVVFINLEEDTEYEVLARRAGTDWQYASDPSAPTKAKTLKTESGIDDEETPEVEVEVTRTSIRVTEPVTTDADTKYEYSLDGETWQTDPIFENLRPGLITFVYARRQGDDPRPAGPIGRKLTRTEQVTTEIYEVLQNADGTWSEPTKPVDTTKVNGWLMTPMPVYSAASGEMDHYHLAGWSTAFDAEHLSSAESFEMVWFDDPLTEKVYVFYERNSYTLTFYEDMAGTRVKEGGTFTVRWGDTLSAWAYASSAEERGAKAQSVSLEGYVFAGWSKEPKADGKYSYRAAVPAAEEYCLAELGSMTMPAEDLSFCPVLIGPRVQIHLDLGAIDANANAVNYNGWSGPAASAYTDENTKAELDASQYRSFTIDQAEQIDMTKINAIVRAGYTPDGWHTAGGLAWDAGWGVSPVYCDRDADRTPILSQDDADPYFHYTLTLTAHWKPREIPAVFGQNSEQQMTRLGGTVTLPETAQGTPSGSRLVQWKDKDGHAYAPGQTAVFTDWSLTQEAADGTSGTILKFTPVFEGRTCRVTFDSDGGSYVESLTVQAGESIEAPDEPTRSGYRFVGWNVDDDAVKFPYKVWRNTNLKAAWEKESYTITFDTAGGSSLDPITLPYGEQIPEVENPKRDHYTFQGWSPALPDSMPAHSLTLQAVWEPIRYEIVFHANEGEFINEESELTYHVYGLYGSPVTAPPEPVRSEYDFAGWSREADGEPEQIPEYMPDTFAVPGSSQENWEPLFYYAVWEKEGERPGQIRTDVETDSQVPEIEPDNWDEAFVRKLASEEDLKRVGEGEDLLFTIRISALDASKIPADVSVVSAQLLTWKGSRARAAQYFDISVYKQIGDDAPVRLTDLNGEAISFTLTVPEALRGANAARRTFGIVRVHEGEGRLLTSGSTATLSFSSDLFSTYALGYADEEEQRQSESEQPSTDPTKQTERENGQPSTDPATQTESEGSQSSTDPTKQTESESSTSSANPTKQTESESGTSSDTKKAKGSPASSGSKDSAGEGGSGGRAGGSGVGASQTSASSVRTGDETPVLLWLTTMLTALAVLAAILFLRRRRRY